MNTHDFTATFQEGIVSQIDAGKHLVKATIPALDDFETAWLPMITPNAGANQFYCLPDVGELVILMLDARGESGVVLGSIFNEVDTTPTQNAQMWMKKFSNGTEISHDRETGNVVVKTKGKVSITASKVEINGDVQINGQVTVSDDVVANGISLVQHSHTGDSGGVTGKPM